jgi:hypothetical protein
MFMLSKDQCEKVDTWLTEVVHPAIVEQQKKNGNCGVWIVKDADGKELPYFGAIGGDVTYQFTPTSLGVIMKVLHSSGAEIDITDYSFW